jgi:CheY-like chemotaxis protein
MTAAISGPPQGAAAASGLDVLVAEDNEVNRLVIGHILRAAGFSYEMAVNGREAVEKHQEFKPRIVLMDVSMPEMNGYEATAAIRAADAEAGRRTPIIGVTAHAVKGDREECLAAGMDDYVPKPVSPKSLSAKIREYLADAASDAA